MPENRAATSQNFSAAVLDTMALVIPADGRQFAGCVGGPDYADHLLAYDSRVNEIRCVGLVALSPIGNEVLRSQII